jgi:nucleoside-diphosphate-sugar epimerase
MKQNLCIIGCGWLGKFTGEELSSSFGTVYGSFRSDATKNALEAAQIAPFALDLESDQASIPEIILNSCSTVIIALPPFARSTPKKYGDTLTFVAKLFSPDTRFIFTSSTGVYPNADGHYKEDYECPQNNVLCYAENELNKTLRDRLAILRLGGLYGEKRHPIKFLAGREMSTNGSEPINLIHRNDIVRLVKHILSKNLFPQLLNVSFPLHETKQSYYDHVADNNSLARPIWGNTEGKQRLISTEKLARLEGFNLNFNPLEFTFD